MGAGAAGVSNDRSLTSEQLMGDRNHQISVLTKPRLEVMRHTEMQRNASIVKEKEPFFFLNLKP